MPKPSGFSLHIERLFTKTEVSGLDLIPFSEVDGSEEGEGQFEAPQHWSSEAASFLALEAAYAKAPQSTKLIEENTVPSWLWRRVAKGDARAAETSVKQILHRFVGSATYAGWKKGVFLDEAEARTFFDEATYLLALRIIAIEPRQCATAGLHWAYGVKTDKETLPSSLNLSDFETGSFGQGGKPPVAEIRNESIDRLLAGEKKTRKQWQKFIAAGLKTGFLALRFADISQDWTGATQSPIRAGIDVLAFRREDGAVDIVKLRHGIKMLALILSLQPETAHLPMAIGVQNLAPLLISQALPYDSEAGRMTAASIVGILTAETCVLSAQLASVLGEGADYLENREAILRSLRNHRRAAYGDRNDYEKISVVPSPLTLNQGVDLTLIAAARRRWDQALDLVQQHGLRFTHPSDLSAATSIAFFMETATQGIAPMPALALPKASGSDIYYRELHPTIDQGLKKLGYDDTDRRSIVAHIAGHKSLARADGIDHISLRRVGFGDKQLAAVEDYLPNVNDIRTSFTQWILGRQFCVEILRIKETLLDDPTFDLLQHLGYSKTEISSANAFVYGHGTAVGARGLRPSHTGIFTSMRETSTEARVRMAAAVQGLISGDAGLQVSLPISADAKACEDLLLAVWRQGVKSAAVEFSYQSDRSGAPRVSRLERSKKLSAGSKAAYEAKLSGSRRARPKARSQMVGQASEEKSHASKRARSPIRSHKG